MNRSVFFFTLVSVAATTLPSRATPLPASVQHVVAYHEKDRFAGWPANGGIWSWGNEIAVAVARGWFSHNPKEHSYDRAKPMESILLRSLDGGLSWSVEPLALPGGDPKPSPGSIDFTHPDFALRVRDSAFFVSYDRARTWQGPFAFPDFGLGEKLTSRTDYVVNGRNDCHLFLSVRDERVQSGIADRAFAVRTRDGGRTFQFLGWMAGSEQDSLIGRSVMPATVRALDGTLVTTLRRRFDPKSDYRNDINWIDAFTSRDDGATWTHATKIAFTDHTGHNGNPPSLVKLPSGRIAVVYAVRSKPYGIRARVSDDHGRVWGPEVVLRDDARTWDIGYCRSIVRSDGKIVTVYYYATPDYVENHIAATIWSP
jgi:hypothetical protein